MRTAEIRHDGLGKVTRDTMAMKADRSRVRRPKPKPGTHAAKAKLALITRDQLDGRTAPARMFDSLVTAIVADLGGSDAISTIERSLVEAFAGASVLVMNFNASIASDRPIDISDFGYVISTMARVSARLGEARRARSINGRPHQRQNGSTLRSDLVAGESSARAANAHHGPPQARRRTFYGAVVMKPTARESEFMREANFERQQRPALVQPSASPAAARDDIALYISLAPVASRDIAPGETLQGGNVAVSDLCGTAQGGQCAPDPASRSPSQGTHRMSTKREAEQATPGATAWWPWWSAWCWSQAAFRSCDDRRRAHAALAGAKSEIDFAFAEGDRMTKRTAKPAKPEPQKPDLAKMSAKLRATVCAELRLDPEQLSPADAVLVARVGALKLTVSDLEAATLRGEQIDVAAYVRASEALEHAVRQDRRTEVGGDTADEEAARRQLRELLMRTNPEVVSSADRIHALEAENDALRDQLRALRADLEEARAQPVQPVEPVSPPPLPEPKPEPPANVVPLVDPARPSEPAWAAHYYGGGSINERPMSSRYDRWSNRN
jgi:hypothetical protein